MHAGGGGRSLSAHRGAVLSVRHAHVHIGGGPAPGSAPAVVTAAFGASPTRSTSCSSSGAIMNSSSAAMRIRRSLALLILGLIAASFDASLRGAREKVDGKGPAKGDATLCCSSMRNSWWQQQRAHTLRTWLCCRAAVIPCIRLPQALTRSRRASAAWGLSTLAQCVHHGCEQPWGEEGGGTPPCAAQASGCTSATARPDRRHGSPHWHSSTATRTDELCGPCTTPQVNVVGQYGGGSASGTGGGGAWSYTLTSNTSGLLVRASWGPADHQGRARGGLAVFTASGESVGGLQCSPRLESSLTRACDSLAEPNLGRRRRKCPPCAAATRRPASTFSTAPSPPCR